MLKQQLPEDIGLCLERRRSSRQPVKFAFDFAFADDVVFVVRDARAAQVVMDALVPIALGFGLRFNNKKTKLPSANSKYDEVAVVVGGDSPPTTTATSQRLNHW